MLLDTAITSNFQTALCVAGITATYSRKGVSCTFSTIMGKSLHEVETEFGFTTKECKDFICRSGELVLNGVTITPALGDTITTVAGTYQVYAPNGQNDCYSNPDPTGLLTRIHTQLVIK